MSATPDQYWACSVCNSGEHPMTAIEAHKQGQSHLEKTGHFTIWGKVRKP